MNLAELVLIASSEQKAEQFLRQKGIFKTFNSCPFCGDKSIGKKKELFKVLRMQKGVVHRKR